MNRFTELFIAVPQEVVACSERLINLGKIKLGKNLDEILYINLTDHIHSAIERHKQGLSLVIPCVGRFNGIILMNMRLALRP